MTPEQVKEFLSSVLGSMAEEFEQDARNESDSRVSCALFGVAHRVGSTRDDLDWHLKKVMSNDS